MPSAASLLAQAPGAIIAILSAVGTLIHQYIDHPREKYEDKVRELQEERWRSVSTELGGLFVTVQEEFSPTDVEEEDAPLSSKYGMFIKSQYNRGFLDDLENELASMDKPKNLFKKCRKCYDRTFWSFVLTFIISVPALVLSAIDNIITLVIGGFFIGVGVSLFSIGIFNAYHFWRCRQSLDGMWEDHHLY